MPTLRSIFVIYTDGTAARAPEAPPGCEVVFRELRELIVPGPQDDLFGPNVAALRRFQPKRSFLLGVSRTVRGRAGAFFDQARVAVEQAARGSKGMGLDVLRLWPFSVGPSVPPEEETLAEDIFSLGFREQGEHGFRAETFGLSKLDQREISFEFKGQELVEEAFLMVTQLVERLLEQGERVEPSQLLSFGFDRLTFLGPEGSSAKPFGAWHPPLIGRLLPEDLHRDLGVLEVRAQPFDGSAPSSRDLTACLTRSLDQRLLLEELDVTGDAPHGHATAAVKGTIAELKDVVATREQHVDRRDSGWRIEHTAAAPGKATPVQLSEIAKLTPGIVRYLALPQGARLVWDGTGVLTIDTSRVHALAAPGRE